MRGRSAQWSCEVAQRCRRRACCRRTGTPPARASGRAAAGARRGSCPTTYSVRLDGGREVQREHAVAPVGAEQLGHRIAGEEQDDEADLVGSSGTGPARGSGRRSARRRSRGSRAPRTPAANAISVSAIGRILARQLRRAPSAPSALQRASETTAATAPGARPRSARSAMSSSRALMPSPRPPRPRACARPAAARAGPRRPRRRRRAPRRAAPPARRDDQRPPRRPRPRSRARRARRAARRRRRRRCSRALPASRPRRSEMRPGGRDVPVAQHDHRVARALDVLEHVRREQHADAEVARQPPDEQQHLVAARRVEAVRRLVEHDQLGRVHERLRELHALLHARRERADQARALLLEPDLEEHLGGAQHGVRARQPAQLGEVHDEVARGHLRGRQSCSGM